VDNHKTLSLWTVTSFGSAETARCLVTRAYLGSEMEPGSRIAVHPRHALPSRAETRHLSSSLPPVVVPQNQALRGHQMLWLWLGIRRRAEQRRGSLGAVSIEMPWTNRVNRTDFRSFPRIGSHGLEEKSLPVRMTSNDLASGIEIAKFQTTGDSLNCNSDDCGCGIIRVDRETLGKMADVCAETNGARPA